MPLPGATDLKPGSATLPLPGIVPELVDAEGKRVAIQRSEIDAFQPSPNSLMPVGFEKQIKPEGFADLLAFLTAKGKYVPVPLDKAATVVTTKGMFFAPEGEVERLVFPDWKPKMLMAAATASSKKLLAPIRAPGAATQCSTRNSRIRPYASDELK